LPVRLGFGFVSLTSQQLRPQPVQLCFDLALARVVHGREAFCDHRKTGLHIFVPIVRTLDFDTARNVSEAVGRYLMKKHPKDITMEWAVDKRTGKIFMDYNMNVRAKTLNSAYSPRGALGGPVSMPVTWDELPKVDPRDFRLDNVCERLERVK